jgi:P pilus assembly chaperone PapD
MPTSGRRHFALAACVVLGSWSVLGGTGASASAPPTPGTASGSTSYSPSGSAFSLTVSPTRLSIGPGDAAATHQILIVNRGSAPAPVTVEKRDFTAATDGSLDFQANAPYSASTWLTVTPSSFVLAPGQSQNVNATLTIPANPEAGDHEVALVFLVPSGQTSANVRINRGVATPVYVTVAGTTSNTTTVTDLKAPGFATGGPVRITAAVHNAGTVHRDFRGATAMEVAGAGSTTFPDFTVLRESTRDVSTSWSPPFICICHPKVTVVNGDGLTQSVKVRVVVIPLVQLAIALGALLILVVLSYLLRRRYHANVTSAAAALNQPVSRGDD